MAGDQALLLEFGTEIDPAINRRVHDFARRAGARKITGIGEMIPSYASILVYYNPLLLSFSDTVSWARELLTHSSLEMSFSPVPKEVPVLYGGESGPDLSFVANYNQIGVDEAIRLHTGQPYLVYVVGFSPGFAAMGTVPLKIQAPRLASPRTKVPGGSVGIGGRQTGIYAVESPGGWQLIGRTPLLLFDLDKNPPAFFQAGDSARFYSIDKKEFLKIQALQRRHQV